ncbi:MAG: hypothetical protein U0837_17420 [Dehalococcoidia bacterium]
MSPRICRTRFSPAAESLQEARRTGEDGGRGRCRLNRTRSSEHPNVATYIGSGKVEEVVLERKRLDANVVIFDDEVLTLPGNATWRRRSG